MKNYKIQINMQIAWRTIVVIVSTLIVVLLVGEVLRVSLDKLGSGYNSYGYLALSNVLSANKLLIIIVCIIISMALFSGWIAVPNYDKVAAIVKDNIDLEGRETKVELPKNMKVLQEQLELINKELKMNKQFTKDAEARKDELVVYLAHDIRTPLTSVLGYLSLLDDNSDLTDEQKQRFITIVLAKAEKMQILVDELFEITRYNVSSIELKKESVNITLLIEQLVGEAMNMIDEKQLDVSVVEKSSQAVFVDPQKMSRVFENILVNAIRYTPQNKQIKITLETLQDELVVQFENFGTTIDDAALSRVFEHFYRGDASRQSHTGGSGLGLAIAKSIVEANQGHIRAFNKEQSVVFEVSLPIEMCAQ